MAITKYEEQQLEKANTTGLTPVVFIHGLWLLPSSWDRWAGVFELPDRGRSLTIDNGRRTVADRALEFVKRFA
jgi:hypothetical protein